MVKRTPPDQPRKRYEAAPFKLHDDYAWMIYDARSGRLVATRLHMNVAYTLAHTLNVADLSAPTRNFSRER
jgi:hypothetical protein